MANPLPLQDVSHIEYKVTKVPGTPAVATRMISFQCVALYLKGEFTFGTFWKQAISAHLASCLGLLVSIHVILKHVGCTTAYMQRMSGIQSDLQQHTQ